MRATQPPLLQPIAESLGHVASALEMDADRLAFALELTRLALVRFASPDSSTVFPSLSVFLLTAALLKSEEMGSTVLPRESITELLSPIIKSPEIAAAFPECAASIDALARGELSELIACGFCSHAVDDAYTPLVVFRDGISLQRLAWQEQRIASLLKKRLEESKTNLSTEVSFSLGGDRVLNSEQQKAVSNAMAMPIALISGGPGTGKTSIAAAIVAAALKQNIDPASIALSAPTGKAAHRLGSAVAKGLTLMGLGDEKIAALPDSATLHRLLGYRPDTDSFRYSCAAPLPHQLLLVDEASMIDLHIFERLLDAMPPNAKLILLGDANQLPSVEAGSVFRDLCERPMLQSCTTTLRESFRMRASDAGKGRNILMVANRLIAGETKNLISADGENSKANAQEADGQIRLRQHPQKLAWKGVELLQTSATETSLTTLLNAWLSSMLSTGQSPERDLESRKILCFTRVGPCGSDAINTFLSRRFAQLTRQNPRRFHVGEPLIVTENDYSRGLFNGDNGFVALNSQTRSLEAVFPRPQGTSARFPLRAIEHILEHAFAITVHKSQGSEYERTLILLPTEDSEFATRDLLYTAMTRSSQSCVLVGDPTILNQIATRKLVRHSLLGMSFAQPSSPMVHGE